MAVFVSVFFFGGDTIGGATVLFLGVPRGLLGVPFFHFLGVLRLDWGSHDFQFLGVPLFDWGFHFRFDWGFHFLIGGATKIWKFEKYFSISYFFVKTMRSWNSFWDMYFRFTMTDYRSETYSRNFFIFLKRKCFSKFPANCVNYFSPVLWSKIFLISKYCYYHLLNLSKHLLLHIQVVIIRHVD